MAGATEVQRLLDELVRDVPDFPKPGVVFKDIAPLLAHHRGFSMAVEALAEPGRDSSGRTVVDKVVGIEARGFILAAPVALALRAGFVPVRKQGKLPGETFDVSYALEYGEATLEVQRDAFRPRDRVLVVDDVLATGGTVAATAQLLDRAGASLHAVVVLLELGFLDGRSVLEGFRLHALRTV